MSNLLGPSTFILLGIALLIYSTGYKGAIGVGVLLLALMALIFFNQNKLLYMPVVPGLPKSPAENQFRMRHPSEHNLESVDLQLNTSDGINIRGWHVKAGEKAERVIVYFHENAGNIGTRLFYVRQLVRTTNSDVIMVAYRGFSDSDGEPSEEGLKRDSEAVLEYATNYGDSQNLKVYVLGRSLGGAVTIHISNSPLYSQKIAGVILENTFTSISDMIDVVMPFLKYFKFLQKNHWRSIDIIGNILQPILFIKSMQDELVPPQHMHSLQNNANSSLFVVEHRILTGTHNSSWDQDPEQYCLQLLSFFAKIQKEAR